MSLHQNHESTGNAKTIAEDHKSISIPIGQAIVHWIKTISTLVVLAFLLQATVVQAFKIPSGSMEQTLLVGDHILVNKLSYGLHIPLIQESIVEYSTPQRGDVVVFTLPDDPYPPEKRKPLPDRIIQSLWRFYEYETKMNIIKRVIGLPGDTVEVRGTEVYINGEQYVADKVYSRWVRGGSRDFPPRTVPPGKVLLLGDNRDESRDARFWNDPFLDISRIKGRAFIIYWNWNYLFHQNRMFQVIR